MKKILFFCSLVVVTLLLSCRKTKTNPCDGKVCPTNSTCNDGTCVCQNSYYVKGECVPKAANTFYFAGKSCYCTLDTFTLSINKTSATAAEYAIRFQPPLGGSLGGSLTTDSYFSSPSGDSIRFIGLLEGTFSNCLVKGKKCSTEFLGKFKGTDQIDGTIRFFELSDYDTTVDECKITLKK